MVDSIKAVLNQLNERYNTTYETKDCNTWNMKNLFPNLNEIELLEIFDSERFFEEVEMYNGVYKFINKHLDITTVVSKGLSMNLYLKEKWIQKHFQFIKFIGLDGTIMDKSMVDMGLKALHIDDNQDNLFSTTAEYKLLYENVPNTDWNDEWDTTDEDGEFNILGDPWHSPIVYHEKRFIMNSWLENE